MRSPLPVLEPVSEFDAPPQRVLVHDPTMTRAFLRLAQVPPQHLEERYLFREVPSAGAFALEHAALVSALEEANLRSIAEKKSRRGKGRRDRSQGDRRGAGHNPAQKTGRRRSERELGKSGSRRKIRSGLRLEQQPSDSWPA
jgi:hypothetical protein